MPLIAWNESIAINIASIDAQHQRWIGLINDLHEAMKVGKGRHVIGDTLDAMVDYTKTHFRNEEGLMSTNGYSEFAQHKAIHDEFINKIVGWQDRYRQGEAGLTLEVMSSLGDWLQSHIRSVDKRYAPHLKCKGVV